MTGTISIQKVLGWILLTLGGFYGLLLLKNAADRREEFQQEPGSLRILALSEFITYFSATLGISDFLMNTLTAKKFHLTTDKTLPGTLVTCGLVPGPVIAFFLLQVENPVDSRTILPCMTAIIIGSVTGGQLVSRLDGTTLKTVMKYALIASLAALIVRITVAKGAAGTATSLSSGKLIIAVVFCFQWGVLSFFGIPCKPAGTALFLLMGLSPIAVLTMILVVGCLSTMGGGYTVIRNHLYHQKMACSSVIFGTLGAIAGSLFAVSISSTVLNILLLAVMVTAIVTMFRG